MTSGTPIPIGTPGADDPRDEHRSAGWTSRSAGSRGISWGWWAALLVAVISVIFIGTLLLADGNGSTMSTRSVMDIVEDPSSFRDERVVVTGRIDELLTDRAIAMGSDLSSEGVLVLIDPLASVGGYGLGTGFTRPMPVGGTYDRGDVAQFTGTIREFDRDKLSDELGLVLNDQLFDQWQGKPVLVVDHLDVAAIGQLMLATPTPG